MLAQLPKLSLAFPAADRLDIAIRNAGGTALTAAQRNGLLALENGCRKDLTWGLIQNCWPLVGGIPGCLIDMVTLATAVNQGFEAADYGDTTGLTGDGASYIDSGIQLPVATGAAAAYYLEDVVSASTLAVIGTLNSGNTQRCELGSNNRSRGFWGQTTAAQQGSGTLPTRGSWIVSRTSSTSLVLYGNGVSVASTATATTPVATGRNLFLFASQATNGNATSKWIYGVGCLLVFNAGLDATQAANMHTRMAALMTAFGRPT